ncbi:MAG: tetratricopeptide repeat protein [Nitrospirales bacterium]|nr:tetratricopeptide repeat protein [Nitrospirales bacterium]
MQRALELNPRHAPSLHMMGMMLEELPWFLGGDPEMAITYLVRATKAKPDYTRARLDLAKTYIKRHNIRAAREELRYIIREHSESPAAPSWQPHHQEAQRLLDSLPKQP